MVHSLAVMQDFAAAIDKMVVKKDYPGVTTSFESGNTYFLLNVEKLRTLRQLDSTKEILQAFGAVDVGNGVWKIEGGWMNPYFNKQPG